MNPTHGIDVKRCPREVFCSAFPKTVAILERSVKGRRSLQKASCVI